MRKALYIFISCFLFSCSDFEKFSLNETDVTKNNTITTRYSSGFPWDDPDEGEIPVTDVWEETAEEKIPDEKDGDGGNSGSSGSSGSGGNNNQKSYRYYISVNHLIEPFLYNLKICIYDNGEIEDRLICLNSDQVPGYLHDGGCHTVSYKGNKLTYTIESYYLHYALYPNIDEMDATELIEMKKITKTETIPPPPAK